MTAGDDCQQYIKSTEVIRILKSGNETFKNRVLNCISKYKEMIFKNIVIVKHTYIEPELLNMCSETAFQDTQLAFVKNVENNKFNPDFETCIPYLKKIFRRIYWDEYYKELKRKKKIIDIPFTSTEDEVEDVLEMEEKVRITVSKLSAADQLMFAKRYVEKAKTKDIAKELGIEEQTVRTKFIRLHNNFRNQWIENKQMKWV